MAGKERARVEGTAKSGLVSFEGEDKTYPHYLFVDFSVYVEKQKGQKTKDGFEAALDGGLRFIRKKMSKGKSNFAIVPRDKKDSNYKTIKSNRDFPDHQIDW